MLSRLDSPAPTGLNHQDSFILRHEAHGTNTEDFLSGFTPLTEICPFCGAGIFRLSPLHLVTDNSAFQGRDVDAWNGAWSFTELPFIRRTVGPYSEICGVAYSIYATPSEIHHSR